MSPTSEQKPHDDPQKRKAFGTGYELWIGLAVGLYVVYAVTDLITGLVHSEVSLSVDFEDDAVSALDVPNGTASLRGLTEISVATGDVSAGAVVFVIIAKIALILTVLGAAISLVPVIRDIAAGTPFTSRASRAFSVLTWIVVIGWIIYFITMMLGSNWIAADIGIGDGVGPGITVMQSWLVLGILGGAELLRRCFRSGRKAQEELEGLV
ncbi:DUF2975 domain-containing protein [Brevibacterium oceani]|uniref:DUF2975 domain-containing protein n=1 Tax=Brevibacterium oceani TaxID=358099 RepID=UPI0015E6F031|nr:DUF2975 domain-containing protein [Brevibacterium oceani]